MQRTTEIFLGWSRAWLVAAGVMGLSGCAVAPGGGSGGASGTPPAALADTYWKLVRLDERPVPAAERQREAHLVLHAEGLRLAGSGGCNRLLGRWRVEGESLAFTQVASTRMACPSGMELEARFVAVLATVARHRIEGETLSLIDPGGTVVARLQAVALR